MKINQLKYYLQSPNFRLTEQELNEATRQFASLKAKMSAEDAGAKVLEIWRNKKNPKT